MRTAYEDYLATAQTKLNERRQELEKQVAKQEGELESEIKGLREKPAGYGNEARKEEYHLTLLQKTSEVELQSIVAAQERKQEVDAVLAQASVAKLEDVTKLQDDVRLKIKDFAAAVGTPMPPAVKLESPLFAVFQKLFNFRTAGPLEYLILALAFLLDLADIIGYSLVPTKKEKKSPAIWAAVPEHLPGPEVITSPTPAAMVVESAVDADSLLANSGTDDLFPAIAPSPRPRRKPFRFRR
ncbi:MAG: hypothetical protein FJY92_09910 [Candidatus Hydrogenedentes bacterium]|nr:hypothetical protein [Candidatus Hydrogenedentota bacterium]